MLSTSLVLLFLLFTTPSRSFYTGDPTSRVPGVAVRYYSLSGSPTQVSYELLMFYRISVPLCCLVH